MEWNIISGDHHNYYEPGEKWEMREEGWPQRKALQPAVQRGCNHPSVAQIPTQKCSPSCLGPGGNCGPGGMHQEGTEGYMHYLLQSSTVLPSTSVAFSIASYIIILNNITDLSGIPVISTLSRCILWTIRMPVSFSAYFNGFCHNQPEHQDFHKTPKVSGLVRCISIHTIVSKYSATSHPRRSNEG